MYLVRLLLPGDAVFQAEFLLRQGGLGGTLVGLGNKAISVLSGTFGIYSMHLHLDVRPDVDPGTFTAAFFILSCPESPPPSP